MPKLNKLLILWLFPIPNQGRYDKQCIQKMTHYGSRLRELLCTAIFLGHKIIIKRIN